MALPTVPCYWTTRKNMYEQRIVRSRNADTDFRQRWSDTTSYFKKNDIEMNKKRAWESDSSMQDSIQAYRKGKDADKKKENLQRRRLKLAELLRTERNQHEAELKGYSKDNYSRIEDMRDRAETLKSAREEKRKNLAQEKLYEHWRQNNPDLRKIENEQHKDYVVGSWQGQVDERQEQLESARKEKEAYERQKETERQEAIARDRAKMEEKLEQERRLQDTLRGQMTEIKAREVEADMLKKEEEELERQQWEVEELESRRRQMDEHRKKQDFGRILLRQHVAQMRRHSKQIQEELELDRKILEALEEKEAELAEVQTARRDKAKADASWMKKVIDEQIRVEKAREAELDMLYQEEAARMWQKREAEWEKERRARERLMKEVMESRTEQIEDRMVEVKRRQEESIKHREQLIKEMEINSQLTRRDQEQAEAEKEKMKHELQEQITSRKERDHELKLQLCEEDEDEKKADEEYMDFLRQETERMRLKGFTPRFHGKQGGGGGGKQAWT